MADGQHYDVEPRKGTRRAHRHMGERKQGRAHAPGQLVVGSHDCSVCCAPVRITLAAAEHEPWRLAPFVCRACSLAGAQQQQQQQRQVVEQRACGVCGARFDITAGQRDWYALKNFDPKRQSCALPSDAQGAHVGSSRSGRRRTQSCRAQCRCTSTEKKRKKRRQKPQATRARRTAALKSPLAAACFVI
eukprot:TRINITY_DN332_c0_g1_i1.p3 TRINITY_DN332_c0_g1~~TRINITY_DN332_c0_g1_i1.p3  ORF type:complete len:189 (+),score=39.45 TRINITY_DN332_c0_g1_i1:213-779(+)